MEGEIIRKEKRDFMAFIDCYFISFLSFLSVSYGDQPTEVERRLGIEERLVREGMVVREGITCPSILFS